MSNDTLPNDLDGLRALVAQLASEHDAAIAESRRLTLPAVPRTVMSPLELDGYLTGTVVTPRPAPIMPSEWIPRLWGDDEPIFDDDAQIKIVLGAVMKHHNALITAIDCSLNRLETDGVADYRPLFLSGNQTPMHESVRTWVRGFWNAMALAPRGRNDPCPCGSGQKYKRCCGRA
jgi:yecA family protein